MKNSEGCILNPYLPEYEYVPDGEPHVFGDRVYVYGSHDRFDGNVFCQNDYICYSASVNDLNNWRYEGIIFSPLMDPRTKDGGNQFWAPDVVQGKDGRFYLYYCPDDTILSIGVAVCDTPAGRYEFYGLVKDEQGRVIGEREGDTYCFDPGVFIDDDGSIYLYSGNGPRTWDAVGKEPKDSKVMKLADDMLTVLDGPKKMLPLLYESAGTPFEGHEFFEASSIRKINGRYYLIYSSVKMHELCYAVSDQPDGNYRYGGVVVSNADIFENSEDQTPKNCFGNNHGGIECINGQYYIFYHRQTHRGTFSRQGCAERITFREDGSIIQAEMTSQGLYGKPLPGKGTYPAACETHLRGAIDPVISDLYTMGENHPYLTQDAPDFNASLLTVRPYLPTPKQYIANCKEGMEVMYRYFGFTGAAEREISVKIHGDANGEIFVKTEKDGEVCGKITVTPSKEQEWKEGSLGENVKSMFGKQEKNWQTYSGKVLIESGIKELYFTYEGEGKFDFLEFTIA